MLNNYHPEKDKEPGAFEWWYTDTDLDNGYTLNITFFHTDYTGPRYLDYLHNYLKDPTLPYNALDYANVKMSLSGRDGNLLFFGDKDFTADQVRISKDSVEGSWGDKCFIKTVKTDRLPQMFMDVEIEDGQGNTGKAKVVFTPIVEGVKIGRGAPMDTVINGRRLYHHWVVAMPTARVKVDMTITHADGKKTQVKETGFGYHDHNWGNHPLPQTHNKWYWGRIAEPDMTFIFASVWNLIDDYPTYKPCVFTYKEDIIASTEEIELIENNVITGLQDLKYTTEPVIRFLEGSGIKGEVSIKNLEFLSQLECYLRFTGEYSMDVETSAGRIKRKGKSMFEYMDLSEMVRRKTAKA